MHTYIHTYTHTYTYACIHPVNDQTYRYTNQTKHVFVMLVLNLLIFVGPEDLLGN